MEAGARGRCPDRGPDPRLLRGNRPEAAGRLRRQGAGVGHRGHGGDRPGRLEEEHRVQVRRYRRNISQ